MAAKKKIKLTKLTNTERRRRKKNLPIARDKKPKPPPEKKPDLLQIMRQDRRRAERKRIDEEGPTRITKPFEPTDVQRQLVRDMVAYGIPTEEIASVVINPHTDRGISPPTLRKHFAHELKTGHVLANAEVAANLFDIATSRFDQGNVRAAIFWLKARAGWKETSEVEVTANTGVLVVPPEMTPDQWVEKQKAENEDREDPTEGDDEFAEEDEY